jgi:hypothetical protein
VVQILEAATRSVRDRGQLVELERAESVAI